MIPLLFFKFLFHVIFLEFKRMYCLQRFADWRWAGFSAQKLVRRTELSATTKLSSGDGTPPIANVLLQAVILMSSFF